MNLTKNKKLIALIFAVVTAIFFAFTTLVIVKFEDKNIQPASQTFAWTGQGTASSPYIINGPVHLDNLAKEVNNGNSFAGKYFKLTSSFDYYKIDSYGGITDFFDGIGVKGNKPWAGTGSYAEDISCQYVFEGHFDGNGNTISGFEILGPEKSKLADPDASYAGIISSDLYLGFFAALGKNASVTNLRLKDFTLHVRYYGDQIPGMSHNATMFVGGIAGGCVVDEYDKDKSTIAISNCSVENMYVHNNNGRNPVYMNLGGITGGNPSYYSYSVTTISNCYVANVEIDQDLYPNAIQYGGLDNIGAFTGCFWNGDAKIEHCVLAGDKNHLYITEYANGLYTDKEVLGNAIYLTKDESYATLNKSSATGAGGSIWYYSEFYNDKYPCLRIFIKWRDITIGVNNADYGTVSKAKITVPNDITQIYSSNTEKIVIMGEAVTATANSGHKFIGWTNSGAFSYTANFELLQLKLTFQTNSNATCTGCSTYEVKSGTTISITNNRNANNTIKDITFTFVDKDGKKQTVKYVAKATHYIKEHNLQNRTIEQDKTIIVTITQKIYDSNFE